MQLNALNSNYDDDHDGYTHTYTQTPNHTHTQMQIQATGGCSGAHRRVNAEGRGVVEGDLPNE